MTRVEPVSVRKRKEAMFFLAGGGRRSAAVETRADALMELARSRSDEQVLLRWAWRKRRCVAAAMILENAGRTGTLFHCPADGPDVDAGVLCESPNAL